MKKILLREIRLLFVAVFIFCSLIHSSAQWKSVRVGGGGAITSMQAHPKVQNLYFITTDVGTPYRWNSTTEAWEGLFYDLPVVYWDKQASGNIAFDPNDVTGNVLYATIGATWVTGTVLKSIDRGTTWTDCKIPIDVKPNNDQAYGQRLAVDPNNSNIVYVTTRPGTGVTAINGTFKSSDAGKTWSKINNLCGAFLLFDVSGGLTAGMTNKIFIGCTDGVYQTTNCGTDFTLMNGSPASSYRADIHSNGTMYVTHSKSVEKWNGTVWSSITPPGNYLYSPIAVNPNNSDQIIVGNASYSPYIFDQYVSNNGGSSWLKINPNGNLTEVPWFSGGIGQGLKDFCWDPFDQNMVWFTDFFNPFQTTNIWAGSNIVWKARGVGEEETVATGNLLCPPSGSNVLLSNVADVGGWDHKSLTTPPTVGLNTIFPWSTAGEAGNMTGVAIQESNPNFIARVGRHGWDGTGYAGYSTDGGTSYTKWTCPSDAAGGRIAVSATSTTMIWITQGGPCYRSTDLGTTWTSVASLPSKILTQASVFTCGPVFPVAADKVNGNKFYVYFGGKMYVSTDAGVTFTAAGTLPNPYVTNPTAMETTPGKEGDIWIAMYTYGLYHSTNSGTSFTQIANVQSVNSVSIGMASPGNPNNPAVYVYGTVNNIANGLFRSNDNGATWQTVSAPLHTGQEIYSMAADRQVYGRVFFNTFGNGIRYVEDIVDTKQPTTPTDVTVSGTTNASTRLTWSQSSDNVNVASYSIYKDGMYIASSTVCSYIVTGLTANTTYSLSVKAKDPSGNLSAPTVISVQTSTTYVAPVNIALNKPASASVGGTAALKGNDGDATTTRCGALTSGAGYWWKVDLGAVYDITGAEIVWENAPWIYKYKIEVSNDDITWVMASDKTANTYFGAPSEVNNFTSNGYRYMKITITGYGNGGYWASFYEFRAFGTQTITGTKELLSNNVKIYPNPVTDHLNIENANPNADIIISTMGGRIVYFKKATTNKINIPVSELQRGLYLIRVEDDENVAADKIIIQ